MGDLLRIEAQRRADAECIVAALRDHGGRLSADRSPWIVLVPDSGEGSVLTSVLGALGACLEEHQITSVKVTVDDQTYVMQGVA